MEQQFDKTIYMYSNDNYIISSVEEVKNNIRNIDITDIYLDSPSYYKVEDNKVVRFLDTDFEHPIVLQKSDDIYFLSINSDWYLQNQKLVENLICYISEHTLESKLNISTSCLITDNVIDSLCKNKNIKKVNLSKYQENGYILKYDDYLKLKESTISRVESKSVDNKLKNIFDPIIAYNCDKKLIKNYTYEELSNGKRMFIYIDDELTLEELENLKYIHLKTDIRLEGRLCLNFNSIQTKLKELNKDNKIVLVIKNKQEFNEFIFSNQVDDTNIFVLWNNLEVPLLEYLKFEKLLYQLVESAKDLSPFERYIYAYNITKQFKEYKENEENSLKARNLYNILVNEFMVCVGYSAMFGDLLDKLGISNMSLHTTVEISYDNVKKLDEFVPEEKSIKKGEHARRYTHIIDEKYGIDGFYIADPTWDNDLENDYYNHLAFTDNESTNSRRYLYTSTTYNLMDLFNIDSLENFYEKLNYYIKKEGEDIKYSRNRIVSNLIEQIEEIDLKFVNNLKNKYNFIDEFNWPNNIMELVDEIGNYILKYVNKPISGDIIMSAVEEVYRHSYGYKEEDLKDVILDVRQKNKVRQDKLFPKRYKEYEDGRKEIYDNEINKFEINETINKTI